MKKILLTTTLIAAVAGATTGAQATPGDHGSGPRGSHGLKGHAHKCAKPRKVGFVVKGTFVSGDATSVTLKVLKANRHALRSGLVTVGENYTATPTNPARIRYVNRTGFADAQPTDKVRVVGKVTKLKHGCSDDNFTPTASVRKVVVIGPDAQPDLGESSS